MIVRCGRCKAELEVASPGEFMCPACGTRNVVRGAGGPAPDPYSMGGLTIPGGAPRASAGPDPGAASIRWGTCPACSFRFAMGEVDQITCPNCRTILSCGADGALSPAASA